MSQTKLFYWAIPALSVLALSLTACHSGNNANETVGLSGAGSTFINPMMGRWTQDFQQAHPNVQINYQSIGSGGGIQQVKAGTVDLALRMLRCQTRTWLALACLPLFGSRSLPVLSASRITSTG